MRTILDQILIYRRAAMRLTFKASIPLRFRLMETLNGNKAKYQNLLCTAE